MSLMASSKLDELFKEGIVQTIYKLFQKIKKVRTLSILLCEVQFSSVAQSCLTLCDPMNRSTPGLPVHHHLPEFTQTHVH